jgi:hypothetical protein
MKDCRLGRLPFDQLRDASDVVFAAESRELGAAD